MTITVFLLAALIACVHGYGSGAPSGACSTMVPTHPGDPQPEPAPYVISFSQNTYDHDKQITVTLSATGAAVFKGFLVQARLSADNDATVGSIALKTGLTSNCGSKASVTHAGDSLKTSVSFTWTAPATGQDDVVFVYTVVGTDRPIYWVKLVSSPITYQVETTQSGATTTPTQPPTTTTPPPTGAVKKESACGETKGCFHDCDHHGDCKFLNTWYENGDVIEFTMKYRTDSTADMYTAMGLSADDDMGDDFVLECVANGNTVDAYVSYNIGRPKSNDRFSDPTLGITRKSGSYQDGVLACSFSRVKTFAMATASGRRKRAVNADANNYYDLTQTWTLLHAHGSASGGRKSKHTDRPVKSTKKANFLDFQDLGAISETDVMVKAHAILMVLAWVCFASIGKVVARYFKPAWADDSSLCGEKVWFQLHRSMMVIAVCCVIAAFIIVFVHAEGYSEISGSNFNKAHPIMGIIVTALAIINPVMALFRPHPATSRRPIFNFAHLLVGLAAYVLATVNIFAGVGIKSANLPKLVAYLLYAWVAWQGVFEIGVSIYDCCYSKRKSSADAYEMQGKATGEIGGGDKGGGEGQPMKRIALILHAIVVLGLGVAVSVVVGIN